MPCPLVHGTHAIAHLYRGLLSAVYQSLSRATSFHSCSRMRVACSHDALAPSTQSILTKPMRFTPLQASTRLPSRVGIMFRTTPPPDGISQVWNCSVLGSKRTIVFGFVPDSLYHKTSCMAAMP